MTDQPKPRVVGFTGTRNGMTSEQRRSVEDILRELQPAIGVHGDCIGADADFDLLCLECGIMRHIRPCTYESMRAHCERRGAIVVAEPKPPMARNRDIVDDVTPHGALIACPPNYHRIKSGSGTWATYGFGRRKGILVEVVFPDGMVRDDFEE